MSIEENYQIAKDSIKMTSLIDYFLMNLNVVASDWLNYNTGWWRGLDKDGDHKKWGYILWDLDATFDYYINYTGVPNISPNAQPCDINMISDSIDLFFTEDGEFGSFEIEDPSQCNTILNGTSPYAPTDSTYIEVINQDNFCCYVEWDETCQDIYDAILNNNVGAEAFYGNIGKHEKIFIKLLEESQEFKQLYYQRYADLMSTVFSCENMITTLDSMIQIIEPEMPRQIDRWGGTIEEWRSNVEDLKDFINQRCQLIGEGAIGCYDEISGPYDLTLIARPEGIGEIDYNTLDVENLPWTGKYFGGVQNEIKANIFNEYEEDYKFSHWEVKNNSIISPNRSAKRASISISGPDSLTAVFVKETTSTSSLEDQFDFTVYPNPANHYFTVAYNLPESQNVSLELYSMIGQKIADFPGVSKRVEAGPQMHNISLRNSSVQSGLYNLVLIVGNAKLNYVINISN